MPSRNTIKIRIAAHTKEQAEELTRILAKLAKSWGKRKIISVRRYDRGEDINKYHRTFGSRRYVNYIDMQLP